MKNDNQQLNDFNYKKEAINFRQENEPIYASCPNIGQCFCTGKCREIIGYRKVTPLGVLNKFFK